MKTITAKEAKNRFGQAIDSALTEGVVMITKNGRDSVVMVAAGKYREMTATAGYIDDPLMTQKYFRQNEFAKQVRLGLAKATDASMFRGVTTQSTVIYRNEEF